MTIPTALRVPFMYVEFDPSRAFQGPSVLQYKGLLIGQCTSSGTKYNVSAAAVGPFLIRSADQAALYFGKGSQIHRMAIFWFQNDRVTPLYAIALNDSASGVPAVGSFAFSGTATAAGEVSAYIDGERISIGVAVGDTAATVATAMVAAMSDSLPVSGVVATATVNLTAKNDGTPGNDIDLRLNYQDGEELPAGITCVVTAMSIGASDIDIADAIDLLADEWYNIIVAPYTDATNLTLIEAELASRFGYMRMIDGLYICSRRGTLSSLSSFGNGRNSPHISCMENGGVTGVGSPTWSCEVAAAYAAQVSKEGQADPARPFQRLQMVGVLPPAVTERFTLEDRNVLLFDGIATCLTDAGGKVRIERAITMYQTNDAGAADIAYLDVNTLLTLMYLRYDFRNRILTKYSRAKLADDTDINFGPNQQIITPKIGKAEAIAIFRSWQELGLVENIDQFTNDLICYRPDSDPNRLDWVLPPDLINQFRVGAATIQFLLQSP